MPPLFFTCIKWTYLKAQLYFVPRAVCGTIILNLRLAFVTQGWSIFFVTYAQMPWMQMCVKHFIFLAFAILCAQGILHATGLTLLHVRARPNPILYCLCKNKCIQLYLSNILNAQLHIFYTLTTTLPITATGSPVCKCGTFKNSGILSCCARGGDWFRKCGKKSSDHTWLEGLDACKSKFG